jgi:hemerythrin-like domain-containing protein
MMKATDYLVDEHRVIERALDALETAADRLEGGKAVDPQFFLSAVNFFREYADGIHHQKEEDILFVQMQAIGIPAQGCPLGVMYAEHQVGRQYVRALLSAAEDLQAGNTAAKTRAIESSRSYISMLRRHIQKEDRHLFPMANEVIPADQHDYLWDEFLKVEQPAAGEQPQAKYIALAGWLEQALVQ